MFRFLGLSEGVKPDGLNMQCMSLHAAAWGIVLKRSERFLRHHGSRPENGAGWAGF